MAVKLPSQMSQPALNIGPQIGPQTAFLATPADVAIYGGAAGGGKSFALLLDPLRHYNNARFGGVIFRKNSVQVRNQGGLWDESNKLYPLFNAEPLEYRLEWAFPHPFKAGKLGARVKFAGLEYDKSVLDWQGAQIAYIGFDELTHFSEKQFFYMLSRNRSSCGVRPYVRATTNPDVNSWVRKFIDWWIGPEGFAIPERSGVIRWFIRLNDSLVWGGSKEELIEKYGDEVPPKSVTFIASTVYDNKIFLAKDPGYLANLKALPRVERDRLLSGNWNVRATAGTMFRREWFEVLPVCPAEILAEVRYWDRAATMPTPENPDPDWSRGMRVAKLNGGGFVVTDLVSCRDTPGKVENLVKVTASQDGPTIPQVLEQDPGSAGVADVAHMTNVLAGYQVRIRKPTKDKVTRAKPASAQAEARNIKIVRAGWNEEFLNELENFSEDLLGHDDIVDTLSGAVNELCGNASILDFF